MQRFIGLIGIAVLVGIALAMSSARKRVDWRIVVMGIAFQAVLAVLVLSFQPVVVAFDALADGVNSVIGAADAGIAFMFGPNLADPSGPWGFVFLVRVLPVIIFFSALMAVLYHIGVMQRLIAALAWVLRGVLRVTGAEALVVAANVFVGQTEAPLCIRPYLDKLSRSQLAVLMVGGFATIAGSVLAGYVGLLGAEFTRHFIAASVMSAPAAFVIAKILEPEVGEPIEGGLGAEWGGERAGNVLDAAAAGTSDGLRLALNVGAMLIAFVSLLALANLFVGWVGSFFGVSVSVESILGYALAPLAFLLGAPWAEAPQLGTLLGQKVILTEFIAYSSLADMAHAETPISVRTETIAAYALCGFANIPSIAIQIGGLSALVPERRSEIAGLGFRTMIGGALASWMTAAIAGLFIPYTTV
ncbi:MAG: NupC/NupG family nucleoside CNT transporter [Phycisphaerae bacterium]|nr:NupC/NupG family nucleoside CNT transporter [Phycisphaerae bacterium]